MTVRKQRPGRTETFSVSVDAATKAALRALADRDFGGNVSAAVTDLAEEARRRLAAGELLRSHGVARASRERAAEIEAELEGEVRAARARRKKHAKARVA